MFEKIVKKFGITVVVIWTTLFFNGRFQIINSWNFPEAMFFVAATVLGAVGAILLIGIILRDLVFRQFLNVELVLICGLLLVPLVYIQTVYGWQNFSLQKANDYSTDIVNAPQYQMSKHERLLAKGISSTWAFMDIPHEIVKADTDSIELPLSGIDFQIVLKKVTAALGMRQVRSSVTVSDDIGIIKTYEFSTGLSGMVKRVDLLVRVTSPSAGSSTIDIRSSSPGRRRDLGLNSFFIRRLATELLVMAGEPKNTQN